MAAHDLSARRSPSIEIEYAPAYEFLEMLITFNELEGFDYEVGNEWLEAVREKAGPELLAATHTFQAGCNHSWKHLLGLAYESQTPRDVPALLTQIEETDPMELRLHLMGYYRRSMRRNTPLDILLRAAEGDRAAQQQFLQTPFPPFPEEGDWPEFLHHLFTLDVETTKKTVLDLLCRWYEQAFQSYEQQLLPILARDAEAKRALKPTMTPERLIETATNGLAYMPEPGLRRVLLIPSFFIRPWNELSEYQDIKIFCYPVADENVTEDNNMPPVRLVRLYKALADERRLRILKLLMTRSYTLQEIADEFGVAKTTMHHHLATLRTAGLVRSQSNENVYSLRHNMLSEVSTLLDTYLKGKASQGPW